MNIPVPGVLLTSLNIFILAFINHKYDKPIEFGALAGGAGV